MTDYKSIFDTVKNTLLAEGSKHLPLEKIQERLDVFQRVEGKSFSDSDYYRILVKIIFYAGFRAAIVNAKIDTIGIEHGICLENKPQCHLCGVKNFCLYYSKQSA